MDDELRTNPENTRPTDPAPPLRSTAKVQLADDGFTSAAGHIYNLQHGGCTGTVSVLHSQPGTWRARHFHRQDSHKLFVVSGLVRYYERPIGSRHEPEPETFAPGEMFETPAMVEHAMYFPVDTVMVSISPKSRTHEEHEADVVRVEWP